MKEEIADSRNPISVASTWSHYLVIVTLVVYFLFTKKNTALFIAHTPTQRKRRRNKKRNRKKDREVGREGGRGEGRGGKRCRERMN